MAERLKLLLESPQLQEENSPKRSATSSSQSQAYVLHLASLPSQYAASLSAPSNVIDIFDKTTLRGVQTLAGHEQATTALHTAENLGGVVHKCLVSSGKDGSVKAWDERSNSHSIKMTNLGKSQALLCFDISPDGMTVAAGTELKDQDASVLYWDPRQPATPLRTHNSTHSEDVTTITYRPEKDRATGQNILLSGSSDGLLCTSNADEDDEDESVIQVGNWGSSISQAGWIRGASDSNSSQAGIWAATDMETFSTWTSELDQFLSIDIRAPVLHAGRTWSTDYLVTAYSSETCNPELSIFAGNNAGDVALLSNMNMTVPDAPWCLHKLFKKGHSGIVRCLLWDESDQTLVTGGEDSKVNAWSIRPTSDDDEELDSENVEADSENSNDEAMDLESDVQMASPKPKKRRDPERDSDRKGKRAKRQK